MRKLLLTLVFMLLAVTVYAQVHVDGYYRQDGTYVAPHYRSAPNSSPYDNYSSKGNYNPYTGEKGYRTPDYNDNNPIYKPNKVNFYGE